MVIRKTKEMIKMMVRAVEK